jgi:DNA mismatch endonuclease (patch repair protein)
MQSVRQKGTRLEFAVREAATGHGVRYRLNNKDLPGSPDLSNKTRRWAIFVHGCFWHGHSNCSKTKGGAGGRIPASNRSFWAAKIRSNRERDARKARELRRRGFRVLTIWECQTLDPSRLDRILSRFFATLEGPEPPR